MSEDYADGCVAADMGDEASPEMAGTDPDLAGPSLESLAAAASILAATALPAAANALPAARPRHLQRAHGWWCAATPNMRGSLLMIAAFAAFAVMMTLIKLAGGRVPLAQILIVRQLVMTLILGLVVGRALPRIMHTSRPGLQFLRGMFSLGAMLCGFTALIYLPMAEATALGFAQVLFVTLLAIVILGEVVDRRRWIAMALGFAGVVIMLRPTGEAMNGYALLAILGALFGAGITISVRVLGHTEKTETILFWQGAVVLIALGGPALFLWTHPTPNEWALMIGIGVVGTAGQWLVTRAYQMGEASALAPLDFVRLLLATASGYLVFAEIPNLVTIVGAALVAGGTVYTMRHNAGARRLAVARLPDNTHA
ncbi:DMT family transporter [Bosea sp. PAMC 26642]|uniref:DMT family transporter n=1 Tax=Bosea sp. (strain PAMC 26642) TaxID=1792307 RepID=UPI00076FF741|nr:DMT family transporter [Bosea sp. PAMC 26642]AMJ62851.1 hypothetical protein AXW83_23425 [Bosea sp. PAMC 26642]